MTIKVLGPGCKNCENLEQRAREALASLGREAQIEKVTDYGEIAAYGVTQTPGLVIDEQLVLAGREAKKAKADDIARLLSA